MMEIGQKAPEILGINENGQEIKLSDYTGRKVVLYFYPKDDAQDVHGKHRIYVIIMMIYVKLATK